MLKIERVSKYFGGVTALKDLSMEVERGEIVGVIGPNGAGKTTLFNVITGVFKPTQGKVIFKGEDLTGWKTSRIAKMGVGRNFQQNALFMGQTVETNVSTGSFLQQDSGIWGCLFNTALYRAKEKLIQKKVTEILEVVGLSHQKNELAKNLPHGYQRMLGIAIALASGPEILLLDEPVTGMNAEETTYMMELIRRIRDELHITILLVEHTMRVVMNLCERIVVLNYGVKIAEGEPTAIQQNSDVIKAYLGG